MTDLLKRRVQERLNTLGISAFEAARRAGFERTFINDLLIGKKRSIGVKNIPAVAEALDCDPEYLLGHIGSPRRAKMADGDAHPANIPIVGVCEAGAWRESPSQPVSDSRPIPADPRYDLEAQRAYIIRGDHAEGLGLSDGCVVLAVEALPYRDGDTVVVRRAREGAGEELTVRVLEGNRLVLKGPSKTDGAVSLDDAEIVGVVILGLHIF